MSVTLLLKGGKDVHRRFELAADVFTVGSAPSADVVITDDPLLEPRHFLVERTAAGAYRIRDLGSRHGTWLDGARIDAAVLPERAVVRAGLTVFQVFFSPAAAEPATPPCGAGEKVQAADAAPGAGLSLTTVSPAPTPSPADRSVAEQPLPAVAAAVARAGYQLCEQVGRGTFGRVYRALGTSSGETVAIKIFEGRPDRFSKHWQLFLREMHVQQQLTHRHLVRLLATCSPAEEVGWFAMEYVAGPSLAGLVAGAGPLGVRDACTLVGQVLEGLVYAHGFPPPEGPFVHRDIKPGNILVAGSPGCHQAKLCDFGLAKNFERAGLSDLTATGTAAGTIGFMSPEQLIDSKYSGPEVDLYAMGGVLYFALTGQLRYDHPPGALPSDLLRAVLTGQTNPLRGRRPELSEDLERLIDRATGHDRSRRFRSAHQMMCAIDRLLTSSDARGRP